MKKILLTIIITALIVGGGYYLYDNYSLVEKDADTSSVADSKKSGLPTSEDENTFYGPGFTFQYPSGYVADNEGLWKEDLYEDHINPPAQCSTCHIPYVEVKSDYVQILDQYIIDTFVLPGKTLDEMSEETGIPYENIKIGNNKFIKITVGDKFFKTAYFTKNGDKVISFMVYQNKRDNEELRNMIATLKFDEDCGDYPAPGDRGGMGNFYSVCRNVNSGACFYQKNYESQILGCDPEFDPETNPMGNNECFERFYEVYDFNGDSIQKGLIKQKAGLMCDAVMPSYVQSKIQE